MNPIFTVMNPDGTITTKSEEEITEGDNILYDSDGSIYMNASSDAVDGTEFALTQGSPAIDAGADLTSYDNIIHNNVFYSASDDPTISEVDSDSVSWTSPTGATSVSTYYADGETWDPAGLSATTTVGETYKMSFDTSTKYTDIFFGCTAFLIALLIITAVSKLLINTLKKTHKNEDEVIFEPKAGRLLRRLDT